QLLAIRADREQRGVEIGVAVVRGNVEREHRWAQHLRVLDERRGDKGRAAMLERRLVERHRARAWPWLVFRERAVGVQVEAHPARLDRRPATRRLSLTG